MPEIRPTTPLAAVEAAVVDTETTGLDARQARIVQIAVVGVRGGTVAAQAELDTLVDPGVPIPPEATAIHGISDRDVSGQPRFAEIMPELERAFDGRLVVGHSLDYDFAILKRECERGGLTWKAPRALDVRALARLVAPTLADHGLDRVCDWLGVENSSRHSAEGDARATAEVFVKLVPLLRAQGLRTLAEVMAALLRREERDARAMRALISVSGGDESLDDGAVPQAIDAFAYRHRMRDVMSAPPLIVDGSLSVKEALALILEVGTSSVFVRLVNERLGIVTERDMLRSVAADGDKGLQSPVSAIASAPVQGIAESDFVYRAIGRMARLGVRHLAVWNAEGCLVGALTPRNLLRDRAMEAIVIGDAIAASTSVAEVAGAWGKTPGMAAALRREAVDARLIAATLSSEIHAITKRAAEFAEQEMEAAGLGKPPVSYAVLVLGSAGRGESLLAADQDNAIVYAEGAEGSPADLWFGAMAGRTNRILDEAGIVLCKGGVMARNRLWRQSVDDWKAQADGWIRRQNPLDLLNVDIFFDAVAVHGDVGLADEVLAHARQRAQATPSFLMMLTELARQWRSPLGLWGGFRKIDGRVDLKKGGLMPIFTGARVMALRHGIVVRSTPERLEAVKALGKGAAGDFDAVIDAQEPLLSAILEQQIIDAEKGVPLSTRVAVDRLDAKAKAKLKVAVRAVDTMLGLLSEGRI